MRQQFWALALASILGSRVASADCDAQKCDVPSGTLHLVGDSQCAGSVLYASKIDEAKRWSNVRGTCKGGTRVPYWDEHVKEAPLKSGDAVVVFLGSNDWGKPDPAPILAYVKASGARCVWVGPPLIRGRDNGVADHLKRVVEADGACKFLDSRKLNLKQEDGVHPGPSEHKRWLKAALSQLGD